MRRRVNPRAATDFDRRVGSLIRAQRLTQGLSQTVLANECGVTFQQLQKYEAGRNRVPPGRLEHIAKVLGMAPGDFFAKTRAGRDEIEALALVKDKLVLRLLRAFNKLDWRARNSIVEMAEDKAGK